MSEFTTRKITDRAGTGAPNFTYGVNIGGSDSGLIGKAYTASGTEPSSPANGDTWYDTANDKFYIYADGAFKQITHSNAPTLFDGGERALYMGAYRRNAAAISNSIVYWTIATLGNAADFGDLTETKRYNSSTSDGTRAFVIGGQSGSTAKSLKIDVITVGTLGNAADHGDLSDTYGQQDAAANCNGTIAVNAGGNGDSDKTNQIQRFTTATASNAADHGDLTVGRSEIGGNITDGTVGLFHGGFSTSMGDSVIDQVTIATAANATDFGDLSNASWTNCGTSQNVRGVIHEAYNSTTVQNVITYVTIGTASNSTDFGDLLQACTHTKACTNLSGRACFSSGKVAASPYALNTIQYIDINTLGNASDFGDLDDLHQNGNSASGN